MSIFKLAITVHLKSGDKVHFELLSCELICPKDTSALIEATILRTLTKGLRIISEQPLHIYKSDGYTLVCKFDAPPPPEINEVYSTGDLAYQMMMQGREGMSGAHCMICQLTSKEFNHDREKDG